jgi:hypothetical protein
MTGQSMNTVGCDLGRQAVRHDAVVVDTDAFAAVKAAGIVCMDQNLLAGACFADQQFTAFDFQNCCSHRRIHGVFHRYSLLIMTLLHSMTAVRGRCLFFEINR